MANVKTFNLSVYLSNNKTITFRGISRVAVKRYQNYYIGNGEDTNPKFFVEERK